MTFEEAARLEQSGELEAGEWVPTRPASWRHGEIAVKACGVLHRYVKAHREWSVAAGNPGVKLSADPPTLRGPDVAVLRAERVPTGRGADGWVVGVPELVVEVRDATESIAALVRKALEYLGAGAKIVWVIDPEPQHVMVFTPPDRVRVLTNEDSLDAGDLLPGFSCRVSELFE